jgi:ABC-type multidrug transport system fused ATPase/permease subunit
MSNWNLVLLEPARVVLTQIGQFLANTLGVIVILIAGWLISKVIKTVVTRGLRSLKIDEISDRIELDSLLEKGGITYSLSELLGVICYWLALLVTFMVAINALGLTIAAELLNKVVLYIPNVIAAIFILVVGMFVATLLRNIVQTAAMNAGLSQVKLLSKVVEAIVMIFAIVIVLEQLNIGIRITEMVISILLGSMGLGLALAFGLGCKDIAGKSVAEFLEKLKSKK